MSSGGTIKSKGSKEKRANGMNLDLHQLTDMYPPKSRDGARRKSRASRMRNTAKPTSYLNGGPDIRTLSMLQKYPNSDSNNSETDQNALTTNMSKPLSPLSSPRGRASVAKSRLMERIETAEQNHRRNQQLT